MSGGWPGSGSRDGWDSAGDFWTRFRRMSINSCFCSLIFCCCSFVLITNMLMLSSYLASHSFSFSAGSFSSFAAVHVILVFSITIRWDVFIHGRFFIFIFLGPLRYLKSDYLWLWDQLPWKVDWIFFLLSSGLKPLLNNSILLSI